MVAGDDRRHRQLHRQQGDRGALPRRHRGHRCRDRRHDSGRDQASEHLDPQRAAGRRPADGKHPRQYQARHFRRPERAARRHIRRDLGAADASGPARAGAERPGKMARRVRGICALDRADRHVAATRRKAVVLWRRRLRAGGSRVLHVRLGQSRRSLLRRSRSFRRHAQHAKEHRLRRRTALLRRRVRLARHGRRCRACPASSRG